MAELMQLVLELSGSMKQMMALMLVMKRTRAELFNQSWIDGQQVMDALNISKRTLQSMRDGGMLPYSRLNGKFYYKVSDLELLLNKNYIINTKINHL